MATLAYRLLNVFTRGNEVLSGNPLCVFEDGSQLSSATMQALARQFNLSETTFILPSQRATAAVRIFTPAYEMPFAGHPTLGTAAVCRSLRLAGDRLELEVPAGIIPVAAEGARWTLQARPATWREFDHPREVLARMLGIDVGAIGERPMWIKAGKEQLIVPLNSADAVRQVRPSAEHFAQVRSAEGHSMAYVFAPVGPQRLLGRFFFPQDTAVIEDPATGSATANLGGWMIAMGRTLPTSVEISQGEYVERPSTLQLTVDAQQQIFVGGDVIELGRGTITL